MRKGVIFLGSVLSLLSLGPSLVQGWPGAGQILPASATATAENPDQAGLALFEDLPLSAIPSSPVTPRFLVHHRSALNGKKIKISGFVVEAILGEKACPSGAGGCGQPRIFIAENLSGNREMGYNVMVLVAENEAGYSVGQAVELEGTVHASKVAVYIEKKY
ncbi:MAG: hypothetical protein A2787_00560 [Omnitrophica WOR_2 bacterium RIFCSPHIGHO2_01_FULL_48_9]|nr:MAG: hypothetical protein A3D10_00025 [Omnitrophica WOR_2 bacterium RIFCSPHIGHO2_02_FULL_48_11]OGX33624.1 MAG: hypothetical protein A2787_00560 [Omnitrophica WOR_2 bacterium RIFCSPHIGHO2_01_FULL_48_9]